MNDDVPETVERVARALHTHVKSDSDFQDRTGEVPWTDYIGPARAAIAAIRKVDEEAAAAVAGNAYQVIGALSSAAGLFEHPETIRALDYFGYDQWRDPAKDILPFGEGLPNPGKAAALTSPPATSEQGS